MDRITTIKIVVHLSMLSLAKRRASRQGQSGQAAVFAVLTLLVTGLVTLALFNTGQLAAEKMRLTNTADAAAYSAAVIEARNLNYLAYTNRAMVANQVAIAQMVSLASWMKYVKTASVSLYAASGSLAIATSWIPGINGITGAMAKAAGQLSKIANSVEPKLKAVSGTVITGVDLVITVLAASQRAFNMATMGTIISGDTVKEVIKRNDSKTEETQSSLVFRAKHVAELNNFSERYGETGKGWGAKNQSTAAKELWRFADVTTASRDPFTTKRTYTIKLWSFSSSVASLRPERAGGTDIRGSKTSSAPDTWAGVDTLSVHLEYPCPKWNKPFNKCKPEIPFGWGAIQTGQGDKYLPGVYGNSPGINPRSTRLAIMAAGGNPTSWGAGGPAAAGERIGKYQGFRPYYDVSDIKGKSDEGPGYVVEVAKKKQDIRTSRVAGLSNPGVSNTGGLGLDDNLSKGGMSALSKARVIFKRPVKRGDGKIEYGNLFNPYWEAKLVDPTFIERSVTLAAHALK